MNQSLIALALRYIGLMEMGEYVVIDSEKLKAGIAYVLEKLNEGWTLSEMRNDG